MKSLNSKMNLFNSRKMKTPSFRTNPTSNMSNDTLTFDHAEEKDGTMYYYPKESYMQKHAMIENNELQRSLREALIEYERQNKPSKHFKCRPVTINKKTKNHKHRYDVTKIQQHQQQQQFHETTMKIVH